MEHKRKAPRKVSFGVITVSTSKYSLKQSGEKAEDKSGNLIVKILKDFTHEISSKELIPDNPAMIRESLLKLVENSDVDAIIITGGTGITKNDLTIETVSPLLEKDLPGFGEIFRKLSYENIGSAAILTRAMAGIRCGKAIFCIPGSPDAAKLVVEKLIVPEISHIVKHSRE